jgi:hypothetical protein
MFVPALGAPVAAASVEWGQVLVAADKWDGGAGVDVHANPDAGNPCLTLAQMKANPQCTNWVQIKDDQGKEKRVATGYEWQCVELAQRFWITSGWWKQTFGADTADQIWSWAQQPGVNLKTTDNGKLSATTISHGDLVVWNATGRLGHVAVVDTVSGSQVNVKEQNADPTGSTTLTLKNGWLSGPGFPDSATSPVHPIDGVVHHPASAGTVPTAGGVDLVFSIDTTGSMTSYLDGVKSAATNLVHQTLASGNARIAVVEYRDYYSDCPEDRFASRVDVDFSTDTRAILSAINGLSTFDGAGCDHEESVYSGLMTAIGLTWRNGVTKAIVLMGDAPPHDPEPTTGYTLASVVAAARAVDPASVYGIDIDGGGGSAFTSLASETGGADQNVASPDAAVAAIGSSISAIGRRPIASAGGPYVGRVGDPIVFDASASMSPVGKIARYEWDFDGDGTYDLASDSPVASHTYTAMYSGKVKLRVIDDEGTPLTADAEATVSIGPALKATTLAYTGLTSGSPESPTLLSATLTEKAGGKAIPNALVTFTLNGAETCSAVTDGSGHAACAVAPGEDAGSYTVDVDFDGNGTYLVGEASGTLDVASIVSILPIALAALGGAALLLLLVGLALAWGIRTPRSPWAAGGAAWPR